MNSRLKLDYKDTDKKIEVDIYGLIFEIKKGIEEIDTEELKSKKNINIEEIIDEILGSSSTQKINDKRKEDGYEEMDSQVALTIIGTAVNAYVNASINPVNSVINNYNEKVNKINTFDNRRQRRNYRYRRY